MDAVAAQDAAAEQLERACTSRFQCGDLRNPDTVRFLPPAPADFARLIERLDGVPSRRRAAAR